MRFQKIADVDASLAASPLPLPSLQPTLAPGKRGPVGMSQRTNYSRVNTGTPPVQDALAETQKTMPPRGAEMLPKRASAALGGEVFMAGKIAARPLLQDLVKSAMEESLSRADISREAALQASKVAEECPEEEREKKEREKKEKKSSASVLSGEPVAKLAGALDFLASEFLKEGANLGGAYTLTSHRVAPGEGPGALRVSSPSATTPLPDHKGQGHNTVPMHPGEMKGLAAEQGTTLMDNNLHHAPGGSARAPLTNYGKHASAILPFVFAKLAKENEELEKEEGEGMSEVRKGLAKAQKAHEEEKKGFAVTERGHEFDAKAYELLARQAAERAALHQEHGALPALGAPGKSVMDILRFGPALTAADAVTARPDFNARHYEYAAKKHRAGGNAWNPFGGMLTPSQHEEGGTTGWSSQFGKSVPKSPAKEAAIANHMANYVAQYVKQAEDAINPARISAGPAVPPETSEAGQSGGAPAGGMPKGPTGLVGSNMAAINYKRQAAYANRKEDLGKYFKEPALTSATDKTLQVAFNHTGEASTKLASADAVPMSVKTAAGRALLTKLAEQVSEGNS